MKADGSNVKEKTKDIAEKKPMTVIELIQKMAPQIKMALPKHMTADRLARIAVTAIRQTPRLGQCSIISLLGGVMQAAQLGLEPNTPLGHAFLIPYWNSKQKQYEANFQIGYQGLIDLCYRSNVYQVIYAMEVYKNDQFSYCYGLSPHLTHVPANVPEGEPIYYYAVYKTVEGGSDFRVWSREKIEAYAKEYSETYDKEFSPWKTNFDAMAKKTVIKALLKYARKSVELQIAMVVDNTTNRVNIDSEDLTIEADYEITNKDNSEKKEEKEEPKKGEIKKTENPQEKIKTAKEPQLEIF